jgi:DNA-binding beta-propeller fold protein YncE
LYRCGFPYVKTLGMRRVTSAAVDVVPGSDNLVYVLVRADIPIGGCCIRVLNWEDEDLGTIGETGSGDGQFSWPTKLLIDNDGNLIVSDEALNRITVMSKDGAFLYKWGHSGQKEGQLNRPSGMAFDKDNNLIIADSFNHRIQKFTKNGDYISSWGQQGSNPGQFNYPWGVAVRDDNHIFISDWRNNRIQHFTEDGLFVAEFGQANKNESSLNRPAGITIDQDGDVYVADRDNNRIVIFDANGRYVQKLLGDSQLSGMARQYVRTNPVVLRLREMSQLDGQKLLRFPVGVTIDQSGVLWIADYGSHRVQVYRKDAERLQPHELGSPRNSPTLIIN